MAPGTRHCFLLLSLKNIWPMKKLILLVLPLLLAVAPSFAQKIRMYKTFGGVVFERDTFTLSVKQTIMILKSNTEAYNEFKTARTYNTLAGVAGFSGVVLLAVPLINTLSGRTPQWGLLAGGAVLVGGSIPLYAVFRARALNALDIYNGEKPTARIKPEFYFYGTGASLVVKF